MNMNKSFILILSICTVILFLTACNSPQTTTTSTTSDNTQTVIEQQTPDISSISEQAQPANPPGTVEVVYFHVQQRCPTCLCFEDRITYVIDKYFKSEMDSGKLIYKIINISDKANTEIVDKYQAYASQLFINKIIDNKDNITDIVEIWDWKCRSDKPGFDAKIKNLIEQSLLEIGA
jgi:hypothetical protein